MVSPPQMIESVEQNAEIQTESALLPEMDRTPAERLSVVQPEDIPTLPIYRLSVGQYHAMLEAGILLSGDPIELLEGWLVLKMGKNSPHTIATQDNYDLLTRLLPDGWFVNSQEPVTTINSEPEPDLLVIRGKRHDYRENQPRAKDVGLVIEVSDSTLRTDRGIKQRIYARAGIPFYWLLNLVDGQLEVYSEPKDGTYQQTMIYTRDETVALNLDGQEIARINVGDLLPE
jgi:Uma2 family endonuclease